MAKSLKGDAAYEEFHDKVVAACVGLMLGRCTNDDGSQMTAPQLRVFFGRVCSYEEEFAEGLTPEQVAEAQWEAIT